MGDGRSEQLRIAFVCGSDFASPSEKQALAFGQQLAARGHAVLIAIQGDPATATAEGADRVPGLVVQRYRFRGPRLHHETMGAVQEFAPTLIHAFNPRTPAVAAASQCSRATAAPVFVHFEDDEWGLRSGFAGATSPRRLAWTARRAAARLYPPAWYYATRASLDWVRRHAAAVDALTPALARHVGARLGRPCEVLLPVTPNPPASTAASADAPLTGGGATALYTGAIFDGNKDDVMIGMRAVAEARRRGADLRFVHAGQVMRPLDARALAREAGLEEGAAVFLGYLPFERVPGLLARAEVLLQPGAPSEFNRLRLPSKMQAYLASGTPTVTFEVGFGELLADHEDVVMTRTGDPGELAERLLELLADGGLRDRIGANARRTAERLFDPERNTEALIAYYRAGLTKSR